MKKVILICIVLVILTISNSVFAGYIKLFAELPHHGNYLIKHKVYVTYDEWPQSYWMKRWLTVNHFDDVCSTVRKCKNEHLYNFGRNKPIAVIKKIRVNTYKKKKSGGKWKKIKQKTFNIKKKWRKADKSFSIRVSCQQFPGGVDDCDKVRNEEYYRNQGYTISGDYAFRYKLKKGEVMCDEVEDKLY